ncbi:MAG: U32 family peptidase [Clostridia bacterium]|nr:U32 family peptidase [Clostridia bacterium]
MQKVEILSPVGNAEMLSAAVRSGADAVYLGLDDFNARRNAENFTIASLKDAVAFCHVRGVKVYLTLNIMLKDDEIEDAVKQTVAAAECGIDGVITADIGYASLIHKVLPKLPIHASTQMTVHSPSAIKPLKEMGFCRVVVSREMSKAELASFCLEAGRQNMEVEVFVHGALCMCMSGQCLLSAMLGGRSGNRGLCAGPCRLPFSVIGGDNYDLSLKDLSLIEYLNELKDMGVASLKIEGRMKRPEYVAAATAACRQMLENGRAEKGTANALSAVFSRSGFTDGYYKGTLGKDMFGIRTKDDVIASDEAFSTIHELYRNERQSVEVSGEIIITQNTPASLTVTDGVNTVTVIGDTPEKALNRPLDAFSVKERLEKTGSTPYFFKTLNVQLDDGLVLRASALNSLRREALEKLSEFRAKTDPVLPDYSCFNKNKNKTANGIKTYIRIDNLSQLTDAAKTAHTVIVQVDTNPDDLPQNLNFAVELPRGISNEEYIKDRLSAFSKRGITTAFCGTLTATELAKQAGFNTVSNYGYNIFNSYSAAYHKENGAKEIVLSPELLLKDIQKISADVNKGIISYGRLPLMLTRNCPVKNKINCAECKRSGSLTDRKNESFPVLCRNGYSELYNSKVLWLADRQNELSGLTFQILYFTTETPEQVNEVITAYKNNSAPKGEFTRGLYYRGVE